MTMVTDVYLEDEHYNPVCKATIPAAWVAIIDDSKQVIGRPHDFKNSSEAKEYAEIYFDDYG